MSQKMCARRSEHLLVLVYICTKAAMGLLPPKRQSWQSIQGHIPAIEQRRGHGRQAVKIYGND